MMLALVIAAQIAAAAGAGGARSATPPAPSPAAAPAPPTRAARRVIIDAGHGGVDPGASGTVRGHTILEKNVTLPVATALAAELRAKGVDVVMTRTTDTLIALGDRGRLANDRSGDLFISIHANSMPGKDGSAARGIETYFLSVAKTEDARRVAAMENASARFETGAKHDPVNLALMDMLQNTYLRESSELAVAIQRRLTTLNAGSDRGVRQAGFAVLTGSYMPAVLVEIGFLSNPTDAAYISGASGQKAIAQTIARATLEYLNGYDVRTGMVTDGR